LGFDPLGCINTKTHKEEGHLKAIAIISLIMISSIGFCNDLRMEMRELVIKNHLPVSDWREAKHHLLQNLYLEKDADGFFIRDVYCHNIIRKKVGPDTMPSGSVVNIEHTWPQSKFPKRGSITQKADLHHLFPTDTVTNNRRANHTFNNQTRSGTMTDCAPSKIGYNSSLGEQSFEPPAEHKGNVARALFYFAVRYNGHIVPEEEIVLRIWNEIDPVDEQELKRNNEIEKIQGNRNIFVDDAQYADLIDDF
jgi:hypothetical protein